MKIFSFCRNLKQFATRECLSLLFFKLTFESSQGILKSFVVIYKCWTSHLLVVTCCFSLSVTMSVLKWALSNLLLLYQSVLATDKENISDSPHRPRLRDIQTWITLGKVQTTDIFYSAQLGFSTHFIWTSMQCCTYGSICRTVTESRGSVSAKSLWRQHQVHLHLHQQEPRHLLRVSHRLQSSWWRWPLWRLLWG